ncbi:CoA transferase [Bradyrhizobium sp. LHD-71]|uniref:CaiB/BaiF CoA transferase family protein n=1 Tax=Bradyrhizobium sp. LHD-71 TaxID=3072141 RepID=UPI00280D254C|nr:CoA transferase [Bradyrhizobium sp. LHD-71]MDQ8731453.1 CoA transferase [Bradyrhizobium sp. LHD-71]
MSGPLRGLRVMDVSIMAAGPWTGALLGMLGAEVIKIEPPAGDGTRWVMPTQRGMGTNFISMNVNKKDAVLDFKNPADRRLAHELAARSDIFVQNFRVGVVERLGLDWPTLQAINPRLIYCSISGFGETGPLSRAGCADPIMQAFSGFACSNGAPGEEMEAFRFTGFLDLATSSNAVQAVLAALYDREKTDRGQKVEVSMLQSAVALQFTRYAELLGAGLVPVARGSENPAFAPDRAFAAKDQAVFVTVHRPREWQALCEVLERADLIGDPRFATNHDRVANKETLNAILAPIFAARPAVWWLRALNRRNVACGIAHNFETFRFHRQIVDNEMIANTRHPDWGETSVAGVPWTFSTDACRVASAPTPDGDTAAVITELTASSSPIAAGR